MSEMTIPLECQPSRENYMAVLDAAGEPCECDPRLELVKTEVDDSLCKPCQVRKVLNKLAELSEEL
jgi:hypothetical protein